MWIKYSKTVNIFALKVTWTFFFFYTYSEKHKFTQMSRYIGSAFKFLGRRAKQRRNNNIGKPFGQDCPHHISKAVAVKPANVLIVKRISGFCISLCCVILNPSCSTFKTEQHKYWTSIILCDQFNYWYICREANLRYIIAISHHLVYVYDYVYSFQIIMLF